MATPDQWTEEREAEIASRCTRSDLCPDHNHGPYTPKHGAYPCIRCFDETLARAEELKERLRDLLAAKDATTAYMAKIPDGCSADPYYLGRLVRNETKAEDAARAALN